MSTLRTNSVDLDFSEPGIVSGIGSGTVSTDLLCSTCVPIPNGIQSSQSGNENTLRPEFIAKLEQMHSILTAHTISWRVTEAWHPSYMGHRSRCHYVATCIDANFYPADSTPEIQKVMQFVQAAQQAGLRPVYETNNMEIFNALSQAGLVKYRKTTRTGNLLFWQAITAPHFSVYCDTCDND